MLSVIIYNYQFAKLCIMYKTDGIQKIALDMTLGDFIYYFHVKFIILLSVTSPTSRICYPL
jgi:hypothetical protein